MKYTYFILIPLLLKTILLNTIFSFEIDQEDDEIVYGTPQIDSTKLKKDPLEEVKKRVDSLKSNMSNIGYDFGKAIKLLYSNNTTLDLKLSDIDFLYKNGIINENQAILIWENLLNMKTERNLELLGYSKQKKINIKESSWKSYFSLFYSIEYKFKFIFAYAGGIFTLLLMKLFINQPRFNLLLIFIFMVANILNCFHFYKKKFYFTSFICLGSFISNVYFTFMSLVVLTGHKTVDYSIFHTKHFKSKEHFLIKSAMCMFIILLLTYLCSVSLRHFMNYILIFFFIGKFRDILKNFLQVNSSLKFQPVSNFISIILGLIILIYAHTYYYLNISYSYDLNSFLLLCNSFCFYYFISLEKFIYIQRNDLGNIYLEIEKNDDKRDKLELFEEIKRRSNIEKKYRSDSLSKENKIDILLIIFCVFFLFLGFYFNTYFYLLLAIYILNIIHVDALIFLNIKTSRLISNFFLFIFLLAIGNMDSMNFSYINEIIAIYDQKFLDALYLLFKLLFLIGLGILNYLSEDFIDLFNIYNYSSYKYIIKETSLSRDSEMTKKLNNIYTIKNVFIEIFEFDLSASQDCVNLVLNSISTPGSNIEGIYIDYLLGENSNNIHIIPMIMDYLLIYLNFWMTFDTFRNNNHSFFFITYTFHKLGIFLKLALLMFEYSKTKLQKYLVIILNIILVTRLINFSEIEEIERAILTLYFAINLSIYLFVYDNNIFVDLFIFLFNFIIWISNENSLFYVGISSGFLIGKILMHYLNIKRFRFFLFTICGFNCLFILMNLQTNNFNFGQYFSYFNNLISSHNASDLKMSELWDLIIFGKKAYIEKDSQFIEMKLINSIKKFLGTLKKI